MKLFKGMGWNKIIFSAGAAALIVLFIFPPLVNSFLKETAGSVHVKITNAGGNVAITGFADVEDIKPTEGQLPLDVFAEREKLFDNGFAFFPEEASNLGTDFIHSDTSGEFVSVMLKKIPGQWIGLVNYKDGGEIIIEHGDMLERISLAADSLSIDRHFLFLNDSALNVKFIALTLLLYLLAFVLLIYIIYALLGYYFNSLEYFATPPANSKREWAIPFSLAAMVFMIFNMLSYQQNPSFLVYGDQAYYWTIGNAAFVGEDSGFSLRNFAIGDTAHFRGYLYPFILLMIQEPLRFLSADTRTAHVIFLAINSLAAAALTAVVLPGLYKRLSGEQPRKYQIYILTGLFFIFWRHFAFYAMAELYAMLSLFAAVLMMLIYFEKKKKVYILLFGVLLSCATSLRQNVQVFSTIFIVLAILVVLAKPALNVVKNAKIRGVLKKASELPFVYMFFIGFLIPCVPQIIINIYRGEFSIFAYDFPGVWNNPYQTIKESSLSGGMSLLQGWPALVSNPVGLLTINDTYPQIDTQSLLTLNLAQIIISHPLEFISQVVTRAFLLINIRFADAFPAAGAVASMPIDTFFSPEVSGYTLANLLVWGSAAASLLIKEVRKKLFCRREYIFFAAVLVFNLLLQSIVHAEWRYVMPIYICLYCFTAFRLGADLFSKESVVREKGGLKFAGIVFGFCVLSVVMLNNLFAANVVQSGAELVIPVVFSS